MMQRARANWLENRDRGMFIFQAYASAWRKKNFIKKLKYNDDNWTKGTISLNPFIQHYFANLFTSEVQQTDPSILENFHSKVTMQMYDMLLAPFTYDDIRKAIISIGDPKAQGPDGLHALLFKIYWHILGEVLLAINSREIPAECNDKTIVMIPKRD